MKAWISIPKGWDGEHGVYLAETRGKDKYERIEKPSHPSNGARNDYGVLYVKPDSNDKLTGQRDRANKQGDTGNV